MSTKVDLPVVFISHGSPMLAVEPDAFTDALRRLGETLPRPQAIVVISAHWESPAPVKVTASATPETLHDFGGFPDELYQLQYPSPGDPGLAGRIVSLLSGAGFQAAAEEHRGLDHGAWVPLRYAYPHAEIPVLEVSLPSPRSPSELLTMGQALAPLRAQGVLVVGSGGIVHNLRRVRFEDKGAHVDPWARRFDHWVRQRLETGDVASLADYRAQAPEAAAAVPTSEHFDPLFVVLGTAGKGFRVQDVYEGFHYGNLSLRTLTVSSSASQKR